MKVDMHAKIESGKHEASQNAGGGVKCLIIIESFLVAKIKA